MTAINRWHMKLINDLITDDAAPVAAAPVPDPPPMDDTGHQATDTGDHHDPAPVQPGPISFKSHNLPISEWSINKTVKALMAADPVADIWVKTCITLHLEMMKRRSLDHANVETTFPVPDQWVSTIGSEMVVEMYNGKVHVLVHKVGEEG